MALLIVSQLIQFLSAAVAQEVEENWRCPTSSRARLDITVIHLARTCSDATVKCAAAFIPTHLSPPSINCTGSLVRLSSAGLATGVTSRTVMHAGPPPAPPGPGALLTAI
ncbi:hypothetical protein EVAR_91875_1 [Eumeta japonica]|uniref:Secreted protein n=1 Tax=Eumeta variegata TaxID=151549 RepID=A0A4C1T103_EUMVA|nr:hypothetical protein EVAR_91875_1 [Eumeta japonica]